MRFPLDSHQLSLDRHPASAKFASTSSRPRLLATSSCRALKLYASPSVVCRPTVAPIATSEPWRRQEQMHAEEKAGNHRA